MHPSPVFAHQSLIKSLARQFFEKVEDVHKGLVFFAPYDVYLDEECNAVQPDIVVVLQENRYIIDPEGHIHGVPDMLIDILSAGTEDHDVKLALRRDLYERVGVREYWVIDPETRLATGYILNNARYKCVAENTGIINCSLLQTSFMF